MKKAIFLGCSIMSITLFATTHSGVGLDAFNRSVSAGARGNAVFSPVSFEIDCVIFSEAFGALTRAKIAERMGVLNGLESVYHPIYEELTASSKHGLSLLHARAFCVPDERKTHPAYRQWMQKTFSAETFSIGYRKGADCWFRSRLDGEMEDFKLPDKAAQDGNYSYYDLVSFYCPWQDPFPTNNTREIKFQLEDGSGCVLPALCDLRQADIWDRKDLSVLRLPMADSAWFFALMPKQGISIRDIRGALNSSTVVNFVTGIKSITEEGVSHLPTAIVIPKLDVVSESDLKMSFGYFRFPLTEMDRMASGISPKFVRQRVRFQLDEKGADGNVIGDKPIEQIMKASKDTPRFILNRPFLFFVFHEPTSSILVVGQFMGR